MSRELRWPAIVAVSGALLSGLVAAGVHSPLRLVAACWFLAICTGMSFVPLLSLPQPEVELVTGVAASLTLDTLVATAILLVGGLSATSGLLALDALCLVGCTIQVRRAVQRCA